MWAAALFLFVAFFWANCPCCVSCIVFSDDFDRADSASLGANWSEDQGTWKIASNLLQIDSPAARDRVTYTGSTAGVTTLQCDMASTGDGDEIGFLLGYTDANNYNAIIFKFGTGSEIRWKSVTAGVTTNMTEAVTLNTSTTYTFTVFKNSNVRSIKVNGVVSSVSVYASAAGTTKWGLFIEGVTGTPTFNNFQLLLSGAGCEQVYCHCCRTSDSTFTQWKITVTGWVDGSAPCSTGAGKCNTNLNGVFYGTFCNTNYVGICPTQICVTAFENRYGEFVFPVLSQGIGPPDTGPSANVCHARAQYDFIATGSAQHKFEKSDIFDACSGSVHTLTPTLTTTVGVCDSTGVTITIEAV